MKKHARNLYLKRGKWYFAQQVRGKRDWIPLNTSDEAEAIRLRRMVRANPIMRPEIGLLPEVDSFIKYKVKKGLYTRNSATTKALCLQAFAR